MRYLLAFSLPLLIVILYLTGALQPLSLISYNNYYSVRGSVSSDERFVIVAQDNESVEHYNIRVSDWPRQLHARLIEKLNLAGADLIVFDYDFSRPTNPSDDQKFASAIKHAGNVVLTNRIAPTGGVISPLPTFAVGALGEGFINIILDPDGYWRRILYFAVNAEGYLEFSLPLKIVELYENFPEDQRNLDQSDALIWGSHSLPYPDMYINYSGGSDSFTTIPYYKILEGKIDPAKLQGKIILVGNTHTLGKDFFVTPTSKHMPGVVGHAHAAATILNDSYITPIPIRIVAALALVLGLLGGVGLFAARIGIIKNLSIALVASTAILVCGYYLFARSNIWLDPIPLLLSLLANITATGFYQWNANRKRAQLINDVFGRYVSRNVVDTILSGDTPVEIKSHKAEVTILFSDIRNFTNLSESLSPSEVGNFLNAYFDEMINTVFKHQGTLDKLMGDAVMSFFGAPLEFDDHPIEACRCALEMGERLEYLKQSDIVPAGVNLEIGIGICTGEAIVGNLGSSQYIDYTVIGDNVNLASRLEGLNKIYGTRIIVSESTYKAVREHFPCRELDLVKVKGKDTPTRIYEILAEESNTELHQMTQSYETALAHYRQQEWQQAINCLEQILETQPADGPSLVLLERCKQYQLNQPSTNWTGITVLDKK